MTKILLVDDSKFLRMATERALTRARYEVSTAEDGPSVLERAKREKFDLILAGHSHGGQVRVPFYGPLLLPFGVGRYDMGLFHTASGPLYVNPGLGWFPVPIRFNCRPEITVFEV